MIKVKGVTLPEGIEAKDLEYPKYNEKDPHKYDLDFELLHTSRFGWVIPTLHISSARRGTDFHARTYAIAVEGGQICTVGRGPHIDSEAKVYVRKSREKALAKFIEIRAKGSATSGEIRDRIGSRRAQTMQRRMGLGW